MKNKMIIALFCTIPFTPATASNIEQKAAQSRITIKEFAAELKGDLKSAIKNGGVIQAITTCKTISPAISLQQSKKNGWITGRTSLKPRNPDNAPDSWETMVLKKFEARKDAGEDPRKMEYFEVIKQQDGKQVFRYMKAIPTAKKPCLACHGTDIKPDVAEALDKLYPNDQARGFKTGDIRGAFSITRPM